MLSYNVPGVYSGYQEVKYAISTAPARATDRIVILGTATDGPKLVPVPVDRPQTAAGIFGSYGVPVSGSSLLVPAMNEAYYAGARNIVLMRITGKDAKLTLKSSDTTPLDAIDLFGKYPGAKYNKVKVEVTDTALNIISVADVLLGKTTPTVSYTLADYPDFNSLVDAINRDTEISDVRAVLNPAGSASTTKKLGTLASTTLNGGDDELNLDIGNYTDGTGYRGALAKAYEYLLDYDADMVVPLGVSVRIDGSTVDNSDAAELANFCFEASMRNNEILGYISVAPLAEVSPGSVGSMVTALSNASNEYIVDDVDAGRFISVIVGEAIFSDDMIGSYINTLAAAYAGFTSTLPPQSGTTNKVIPNVRGLRYNLSAPQLEVLCSKKYVSFKNKPGRGIVTVDGIVASRPDSSVQSQSTVRSIFAVMRGVRAAVEPFIGEPLDLPHINAMDSAIKDVLDRAVKDRVIMGGTFKLLFGGNSALIGNVDVELELDVPAELRRIRIIVTRRVPTL